MRFRRVRTTVLVAITAVLCWASASAQQIRYFPDFSSAANLHFNGNAHLATWNSAKVLRLTDGYSGVGIFHPESSTTWFALPPSVDPNLGRQAVNKGFTTYFKFQIHTAFICCTPADGLAFVVQNSSATALGTGSGGLGYSGIPNSLAVEFDTFANPWDPNANHVAVQSCGTQPNSPMHNGNCLVGSAINTNIPHLGVICTSGPCKDGSTHEAVIEYDAPPFNPNGIGTLIVWIDPPFIPNTHTPCPNNTIPGCPVAAVAAINIPYNIDNTYNPQGISLAGGSAWVGFTASQTTDPQAHDILAWEFTTHAPAQVQQPIPPGGTPAVYNFGAHDTVVNYFQGFTNNGCDPNNPTPGDPCLMTVLETPINRNDFTRFRLSGTQFSNERCVVYLGTGGKCVVYSITCQQQSKPGVNVTCPASANPCDLTDPNNQAGCINFSTSFYTADGITPTNADYLKADPVGSNNWVSIFVSYNPNLFDGLTAGKGHDPSDFVATFNPNLP